MARFSKRNERGARKRTKEKERQREGGRENVGRENVLKERRESVWEGERENLTLSLFPPTWSERERERDEMRRMKDREGRGERKGENGRCERASGRAHEQGVAVAVAAAALPPHH